MSNFEQLKEAADLVRPILGAGAGLNTLTNGTGIHEHIANAMRPQLEGITPKAKNYVFDLFSETMREDFNKQASGQDLAYFIAHNFDKPIIEALGTLNGWVGFIGLCGDKDVSDEKRNEIFTSMLCQFYSAMSGLTDTKNNIRLLCLECDLKIEAVIDYLDHLETMFSKELHKLTALSGFTPDQCEIIQKSEGAIPHGDHVRMLERKILYSQEL